MLILIRLDRVGNVMEDVSVSMITSLMVKEDSITTYHNSVSMVRIAALQFLHQIYQQAVHLQET